MLQPFKAFLGRYYQIDVFLCFINNIRHILRLHLQNHTQSEIIVQTGISRKVLKSCLKIFSATNLRLKDVNELSDIALDELFPIKEEPISVKLAQLLKHFPLVDKNISKKKSSIHFQWEEYLKKYPDGLSFSHFKRELNKWKTRVHPSMHREHKAGDKMFIDFAGEKLSISPSKNETTHVDVFVAILGASQLTYVEAMLSQQKEDFIPACENALHYFNGVPAAIVPDNLKSAVTKSSKYEPTINETFNDFAEHYSTTILPARAYKPKDKALVENAIKIIYRCIYTKIKGIIFISLEELNKAISLTLEEHNNQLMVGRDYSRRQKYEEMERNTLIPLPVLRYEFKKQLFATVAKTGHVALSPDKHYYSVPHQFIGKKVKLLFSRYIVEIYYNYDRIALHQRVRIMYKYTTDNEHLNVKYRFLNEMSHEYFIQKAGEVHEDVKGYINKILDKNQYPEKSYRLCMGVLGLTKKFGQERLIKACQKGLDYGTYNYKIIKKILDSRLDILDDAGEEPLEMPQHENIRGINYYK